MSIENKPTQPILITPVGGSEISNLNPVINIQFTQSTDLYYLDNIETTTKVQPDGDAETGTNQINAAVDEWVGFYYSHAYQTSGRIGKIKLKFNSLNGYYAELWEASRNSPEDGVVTTGKLVHSGNIDSDGSFDIPYEKAQRFVGDFLFKVKTPGGTYLLPKGSSIRDHLGEFVAENDLYKYDNYDHAYNANMYLMGFYADIYMYGGHNDDICYEVELSVDGGQNWKSLANGIYGEPILEYDFTDEIENSNTYLARVRVRAQDDNSSFPKAWTAYHQPIYREPNYTEWSVSEPFTIIKHTNPEIPTNLFVSDTGIIDKNIINRLSWKHNHNSINNRQGKADIRWRVQGQVDWNLITAEGMSQFYDVPANAFPIGVIEWQVMTYSYVMLASPWSEIATFEVKDTPAGPTITTPSGLVNEPSPAVAWSHTYLQTHYQINVLDMADAVVWTSGEVESVLLSSKITKYLANLTDYKIQIRVKTNEGLWSAYTEQLFNTDYQYPAPAIITATSGSGFITISYDNPTPTGQQPIVSRNEVYKRIDNEWVKISEASPHSFNDYAAANGVANYYFVRSIASNDAYTDSDIVSAVVSVRGVVLHLVNDPEGTLTQFMADGHGRSQDWTIESSVMHFKGRKRPVVEVGTMEEDVINFSLMLIDEEEKQALDKIVYSGHICCYRDGRGRIGHGIFTEYSFTDERWGGYSTQLSLLKIDYVEGETLIEDDGIINVVINGGEFY